MEIRKTRRDKPPRILIHADHKLGKSSLAASAPNPIFIQTEDGLDKIDANAFPLCKKFDEAIEQLSWVYSEKHDFQTVVIDSLDWMETLIFRHVCEAGKKNSISDFGYGSGYTMALEQFGRVKNALHAIREERSMGIILIAHSHIKTYQNPLGADYDRHCIKLREKNSELFTEWVDLIGFLHFQVFTQTKKDGFGEVTKAHGGNTRVLSCAPSAAYEGGNRYGITEDIELPNPVKGWENLITAIRGGNNNG